MISVTSICGFLLGVTAGAVIAACPGESLLAEAGFWLHQARWRIYLQRETYVALRLWRIDLLLVLALIWAAGLAYTAIFTYEALSYLIASLVGAAAAPWVWLHFSRSLDEPASKGGDGTSVESATDTNSKNSNGQFARYRFVTIMLSIAILLALLQPYLGDWLGRAEKIEGFGVALNFGPVRTEQGAPVAQIWQGTVQATDTIGRLSVATQKAHLVINSKHRSTTLTNVTADNMVAFGDLSLMDRDKVYIAYLQREHNARIGGGKPATAFANLKDYVGPQRFDQGPDEKFLQSMATLSECISIYAKSMRDFHLFFADSETFLRALLTQVAAQWRDMKAKAPVDSDLAFVFFRNDRLATNLAETLARFREVTARSTEVGTETWRLAKASEACSGDAILIDPIKEAKIGGIGKTPYPAYMIAHYMAAIDAVDTGVIVLRDWLNYQKSRKLRSDPEQAWYTIRAMLAASQLPTSFGGVSPTHSAFVQFQLDTTDRMATLLGVGNARAWRSFCQRLDQPGLHAQIGRSLAFNYADERNFLFEILRPEDFGLPGRHDESSRITDRTPAQFLEEAEAILGMPECFTGVPRFVESTQKFMAQYHLNAAQLRYFVRLPAKGEEKRVLTRKIRADLERADPLKTQSQEEKNEDRLDLLRQPNEFVSQRERLVRFQKALDAEREKD